MFFFLRNKGKRSQNNGDVLRISDGRDRVELIGDALTAVSAACVSSIDKILGTTQNGSMVVFNDTIYPEQGANTLLFGRAMAGKTISFLMPDLLRVINRKESTIIADPDGELYDITSDAFECRGYDVKVLDLRNPSSSNKWSPTEHLGSPSDVEGLHQVACAIAQTMTLNLLEEPSSEVSKAVEALLVAVIMRVYLDPEFRSDFGTICNITGQCKVASYANEVFNSDNLDGMLRACLGPYERFRQEQIKPTSNISDVIENVIEPLQNKEIMNMLSADDFDFRGIAVGDKPCAYYVVFNKDNNEYKAISALFFRVAYTIIASIPKRDFKRPVSIYLDGLNDIGYIPRLGRTMNRCIRLGLPITSTIAVQKINDLRLNYKDDWQEICLASFIQLSLGFGDELTAKYFASLANNAKEEEKKPKFSLFGWRWRKKKKKPVEVVDEVSLLQSDLNDSFIVLKGIGWAKCNHREV